MLAKFIAWDTSRIALLRENCDSNVQTSSRLFASMAEVIERVNGPVLELGAGNGSNFRYYPKDTVVITIDLNGNFRTYLEKNLEKYKHIKLKDYLIGNAENMRELIPDGSCSCVVSSLLLCCADQKKVLSEVMRVLKPGGRFYFIEHIVEKPGTWVRFYQKQIEPFWASVRSNCHLTRNTDEVIQNFGFDNLKSIVLYREVPLVFFLAVLPRRTVVGHGDKPIE